MDRRTILKYLAAGSIAGYGAAAAEERRLRVVVAGAGIIGASVAYHLARESADVTVIDMHGPASHASRGTFAWINATWAKQPKHYHAFSQASVAYWRHLQESLNLPVRWGGSLEWYADETRQQRLAEQIEEQAAWGEPARMLDSLEFARLEPGVKFPADWHAAYSGNDGAVDPVSATQKLLAAATDLGARLRYPCKLLGINTHQTRLQSIETSLGTIDADRLVLATGAAPGVTATIAGVEIPQRSRPGIIVITEPMPMLLRHIIAAPGVHLHQRSDRRIVIGEQDGAPENDAHAARLADWPSDFPTQAIAKEHASRMLQVAIKYVPEMHGAKAEKIYIGWRPLPIDGHPVIGAAPAQPNVYLAIMHSGVTLAPIAGQTAAREILHRETLSELAPYRPDRSFDLVRRY